MSFKQLEKEKKRKELEKIRDGLEERMNKVILLEPICIVRSKKGKHEFIESIFEKNKLDKLLESISKKHDVNQSLLSSSRVGANFDVESFILLNEWCEERNSHTKVEMYPLQSEYINEVIKKYKTRYVYRVYLYLNRLEKKTTMVSELINLETGKKIIDKISYKKGFFSEVNIHEFLEADFKLIEKSK